MKEFLHSYFGFNRQQRNGLLFLMALSFFLLVVRIAYPYFLEPSSVEIFLEEPQPLITEISQPENLSNFNPNTASREQLIALGFTEKTAKTLIKYREKHQLRKKEDLLKVYGVDSIFYVRIQPYISIPQQEKPRTEKLTTVNQKKKRVEINAADSTALIALNGIGHKLASRIIRYRNMLGGFVNKEQLREVYGLSEENYNRLHDQVWVDTTLVTRLDLNTAAFKTINRHPYISYEMTKTIFEARRKTKISGTNIREVITNDSIYARLRPYLSF